MSRARRRPAGLAAALLGIALAGMAGVPLCAAPPHLVSLPAAIASDQAVELADGLATLLSSATGERFIVAAHDNSLDYLDDLEQGRFALVFEGPHVLGALARRGLLEPVAEFMHPLSYVVVVSTAETGIYQLADLAGKPLCGGAIPDLFAVSLLASIDNPTREPVILPAGDARHRVRRLLGGRCRAATLQTDRYLAMEEADGADELRVIHKSREMPGFGAGVSAALPVTLKQLIAEVLLSAEGRDTTRALAVTLVGTEAPLNGADFHRFVALASLMDPYLAPRHE